MKQFLKKVWSFLNFKEIGGFGIPLWLWIICTILFIRLARNDLRQAISIVGPVLLAAGFISGFKEKKKE